jgi:hypothetical protein
MLQIWMKESNSPGVYPNFEGSGLKSLAALDGFWALDTVQWLNDYIYLPGLRTDDPANLVMFYVKTSSKQRWHGDHPTIFGEKRWVVISPQFSEEIELNEWLSTAELRKRITNTLEFLKTNDRPYWQNIVTEQTKLLENVHD